jgi:hypothetical protein
MTDDFDPTDIRVAMMLVTLVQRPSQPFHPLNLQTEHDVRALVRNLIKLVTVQAAQSPLGREQSLRDLRAWAEQAQQHHGRSSDPNGPFQRDLRGPLHAGQQQVIPVDWSDEALWAAFGVLDDQDGDTPGGR